MWHHKFSDNITYLGFSPCYAYFKLWMQDRGDHYEYIDVMVDYLLIFRKEPGLIVKSLQEIWGYDLKGVGEPEYYSRADIEYGKDKKFWTVSAKTYINSVCDRIEKLTKTTLKNYGSPLDAGGHIETENTYILPPNNISVYQMLIGSLQWDITLGRWDVQYSTNTLAHFAQKPCDGHFKQALRVFGYLKHHFKGKIYPDPETIYYHGIEFSNEDWTKC